MECSVCNDRTGSEHHLEIDRQDGTTKEVDIDLCNICATEFEDKDWIDVR